MNIIFNPEILHNIGFILFHINSLIELKVHLINLSDITCVDTSNAVEVSYNLKQASANLYELIIENLKSN